MKSNILFIGFMGVGKGTIAREIAKKTHKFAIDTDDLIESFENRSIKKIFKTYGELYFRQKEQECAIWLENNIQNTIISAGGGFYKVKNLKQIGTIIYLKSSFDYIINRLENSDNYEKKIAKRPLLQDKEKAKELFLSRQKEYESLADFCIDIENKKLQQIVEEILKKI